MSQISQNSTQVKPEDAQAVIKFIDTLVQAILGYTIEEIPEKSRPEVIKDCVDLFSQFIINFVNEKYGAKESIRLKAAQAFAGQDIFNKFKDLGNQFDDAYQAFIDVLKEDLVEKPEPPQQVKAPPTVLLERLPIITTNTQITIKVI